MLDPEANVHTGFRLYAVFTVLALSVLMVGLVRSPPSLL